MKRTKSKPKTSKQHYMLYRVCILIGGLLALMGLLLMFSGQFLWGILLILAAIPLAGIDRVSRWVYVRF